jgi:hypothetical protein
MSATLVQPEQREVRLLSGPMISTPGILAWAINGYKFKKDRKNLLRVFVQGYGGGNVPSDVYDKLLKGEIEWREEPGEHGNDVVFSYTPSA